MVYQDSRCLPPSAPKGNTKFEILLVKIFSLKQNKSNTSIYYRKNDILFLQQPHVPLGYKLR